MRRSPRLGGAIAVADWRTSDNYAALLASDRRAFAWEWLRRNPAYRSAFAGGAGDPRDFGLIAFADPDLAADAARPIWTPETDPQVLDGHVIGATAAEADQFDIRALARFVSVEISGGTTEHWLISDGQWSVRLDISGATLLGGPLLLDHRLRGIASAERKLMPLRQLIALASAGELPTGLRPRESRARRWVLELRTADGMMSGATQQQLARTFFGRAVAPRRWRLESASYRLRVQRLVQAARRNLDAPLGGPWFD